MPPYSSGNGRPNRPISAIPATTSYGKVWLRVVLGGDRRDDGLREVARRSSRSCWYSSGSWSGGEVVGHARSSSLRVGVLVSVAGGDDAGEQLVDLHLVARRDEQFDGAVDGRGQRVLHLHRLDDDQRGRPRRRWRRASTPTAMTVPGIGLVISASPACASPRADADLRGPRAAPRCRRRPASQMCPSVLGDPVDVARSPSIADGQRGPVE